MLIRQVHQTFRIKDVTNVKAETRKMAIDDVLLLKAARNDDVPNLKYYEVLGHQRPNFDRFIYIRFAVPPYAAGTVMRASVYVGWAKSLVLSFGVCGSQFMKL